MSPDLIAAEREEAERKGRIACRVFYTGAVAITLRKWYADVVSNEGDAWIAYRARLEWGSVRLAAASLLRAGRGRGSDTSFSLSAGEEPAHSQRGLEWDHSKLGLRWRMEATMRRPITRELLRRGTQAVEWRCCVPAGKVIATLGVGSRAKTIEGSGYAEELVMTIAPWDLPIRELLWGRALAGRTSVIWIEWRGPRPLKLVYVNGKLENDAEITDDRVRCRGVEVCLAEACAIRDGPIGTAALAGVPGVASWAPAAFLSARETKWVARAEIRSPRCVRRGWAIHEVVRFMEPRE